jgi:hypothetical protein
MLYRMNDRLRWEIYIVNYFWLTRYNLIRHEDPQRDLIIDQFSKPHPSFLYDICFPNSYMKVAVLPSAFVSGNRSDVSASVIRQKTKADLFVEHLLMLGSNAEALRSFFAGYWTHTTVLRTIAIKKRVQTSVDILPLELLLGTDHLPGCLEAGHERSRQV